MESSKRIHHPRAYYQEHTRDPVIEAAARELFKLLNKNSFYSIEDLGAIANIILKSEGKTPRRQW